MRWRVRPSGEPYGVEVVNQELAQTTAARCITEVIAHLQFPKHQEPGEPITFPFKF